MGDERDSVTRTVNDPASSDPASSDPASSDPASSDPAFGDTVPATPGAGALSAGEVVGDYEVVDAIGRGGMGAVYLALDRTLHRPVALKVVQPERLGSAEAVVGFLDEARITARVVHPHVVTVYGVGEYRGAPYVALEYVEGPSLAEVLDDPDEEPPDAVRVVAEIAEAVAEAHRYGVIHRDLKPANIIMPREGPLRVVDFGIAKRLSGESPPSARSALLLGREYTHAGSGTPGYMAPEQWTGRACSEATDTWALGVILFRLLSGRLPFDADSFEEQRGLVTGDAAAPPLPPEAGDEALRALVAACLAKAPERRPPAAEVARRLRARRDPITAVADERVPESGEVSASVEAGAPRRLWGAVAVAFVVGAVALGAIRSPAPPTLQDGVVEAVARRVPPTPIYDPAVARERMAALASRAARDCGAHPGPASVFVRLTMDPVGSPAVVLTEEDGPRHGCVRRIFQGLRLEPWHGPPVQAGQLVRFGDVR